MSYKLNGRRAQVRVIKDSPRGASDVLVPVGTLGAVLGSRPGEYLVWWYDVTRPTRTARSGEVASHSKADLEVVGRV